MKNTWNKIANKYDKSTNKMFAEANRKVISQAKRYCKKQDIVLDVGCGTGLIIQELAPCVSKVKAIDTSPGMIHVAQTKNISNIEWEVNDIYGINIKNKKYSVITAFNLLLYVEHIDEFLSYTYDILPDQGYFISVTDCLGELNIVVKCVMLLGDRLGIFPNMKMFKNKELKRRICSKGYQIVYEEIVCKRSSNYLIIAQKRE